MQKASYICSLKRVCGPPRINGRESDVGWICGGGFDTLFIFRIPSGLEILVYWEFLSSCLLRYCPIRKGSMNEGSCFVVS